MQAHGSPRARSRAGAKSRCTGRMRLGREVVVVSAAALSDLGEVARSRGLPAEWSNGARSVCSSPAAFRVKRRLGQPVAHFVWKRWLSASSAAKRLSRVGRGAGLAQQHPLAATIRRPATVTMSPRAGRATPNSGPATLTRFAAAVRQQPRRHPRLPTQPVHPAARPTPPGGPSRSVTWSKKPSPRVDHRVLPGLAITRREVEAQRLAALLQGSPSPAKSGCTRHHVAVRREAPADD